jgi:hypothetical protein
LGGFEKEERGKKRRERKGERREKRGKKGGQPNPHSAIPREKMQITKKTIFLIFLFNFFVFLNFFEMKLRPDLENPKTAIKKMGGGR